MILDKFRFKLWIFTPPFTSTKRKFCTNFLVTALEQKLKLVLPYKMIETFCGGDIDLIVEPTFNSCALRVHQLVAHSNAEGMSGNSFKERSEAAPT